MGVLRSIPCPCGQPRTTIGPHDCAFTQLEEVRRRENLNRIPVRPVRAPPKAVVRHERTGLVQQVARPGPLRRLLRWKALQPGTRLLAVDRVMGFKRGQKARELGVIEVVSVRRERLDDITDQDVLREGFIELDASGFVAMFCRAMRCDPGLEVTRVEFRVLRFNEGICSGS